MTNTNVRTEKLLIKVREQSDYTYKIYKGIIEQQQAGKLTDNKVFQYERAKLIGMLDMLDILEIDRKEFNWIFYTITITHNE